MTVAGGPCSRLILGISGQENIALSTWIAKGFAEIAYRPVAVASNLKLTDETIRALLVPQLRCNMRCNADRQLICRCVTVPAGLGGCMIRCMMVSYVVSCPMIEFYDRFMRPRGGPMAIFNGATSRFLRWHMCKMTPVTIGTRLATGSWGRR